MEINWELIQQCYETVKENTDENLVICGKQTESGDYDFFIDYDMDGDIDEAWAFLAMVEAFADQLRRDLEELED